MSKSCLVCLFALALAAAVKATPGGQFTVPRPDVEAALAAGLPEGGLSVADGEIVSLTTDSFDLLTGGAIRRYTLRPACKLYANGRSAALRALRPVAPGAFFWARVWADGSATAWAVEAVYAGGELILTGLGADWLSGISPATGGEIFLPLAAASPRPSVGDDVYVLLDLEGRVRWLRFLD